MKNMNDMDAEKLESIKVKSEKQTKTVDKISQLEEIIGPGIQGGLFLAGAGTFIGGEVVNDFNLMKSSAIFGLAFALTTGFRAMLHTAFKKLDEKNKKLQEDLSMQLMKKQIEEKD